jgi:hypothetical protein
MQRVIHLEVFDAQLDQALASEDLASMALASKDCRSRVQHTLASRSSLVQDIRSRRFVCEGRLQLWALLNVRFHENNVYRLSLIVADPRRASWISSVPPCVRQLKLHSPNWDGRTVMSWPVADLRHLTNLTRLCFCDHDFWSLNLLPPGSLRSLTGGLDAVLDDENGNWTIRHLTKLKTYVDTDRHMDVILHTLGELRVLKMVEGPDYWGPHRQFHIAYLVQLTHLELPFHWVDYAVLPPHLRRLLLHCTVYNGYLVGWLFAKLRRLPGWLAFLCVKMAVHTAFVGYDLKRFMHTELRPHIEHLTCLARPVNVMVSPDPYDL